MLLDGVRVQTGTLRDQIIYPDMIEDMHAKGLNDANLLELISEVRGPGVRRWWLCPFARLLLWCFLIAGCCCWCFCLSYLLLAGTLLMVVRGPCGV